MQQKQKKWKNLQVNVRSVAIHRWLCVLIISFILTELWPSAFIKTDINILQILLGSLWYIRSIKPKKDHGWLDNNLMAHSLRLECEMFSPHWLLYKQTRLNSVAASISLLPQSTGIVWLLCFNTIYVTIGGESGSFWNTLWNQCVAGILDTQQCVFYTRECSN